MSKVTDEILTNTNLVSQSKVEKQTGTHIDILDGFRGLAILLVMWFHIWQQSWLGAEIKIFGLNLNFDFIPRTGFLGVELFFFISGFVLFYPYARSIFEGTKSPTLKKYAYRRFIKIVPTYYLSLFVMILLPLNFRIGDGKESFIYIIKHLFFINSLTPDTFFDNINGVLWSLSVEVQFYLIFPILVFFMKGFRSVFVIFITTNIFAIMYRNYYNLRPYEISFMFNQLPGVIDIFIGGMITCYLVVWARNKFIFNKIHKTVFVVLSLLSLVSFFYMVSQFNRDALQIWQSSNRQYFVFLFMGMMGFGCLSSGFWRKIVANKILVFLSIVSYNLYIWHDYILLQLLKYRIPHFIGDSQHNDPSFNPFIYTILAFGISIAVATLVTYLFERPLLKYGFKGVFAKIKSSILQKQN
jgi:peptidoglycan/LPS O-acetylase OafA/YrhL